MGAAAAGNDALNGISVICLCAGWCTACREYRGGFEALAADFPQVRFRWLDIEDEAEALGELDIENFPTLLIGSEGLVLFYGAIRPQHEHLRRMIGNFLPLSLAECREQAFSGEGGRAWQADADLRRLCAC